MAFAGIVPSQRGKPFASGPDPRRSMNGAKPRKILEIEAALDAEHRTVITRHTDPEGNMTESIKQPNPAFMKLYLDRVLGPVADGSDDKIQRLARELLDSMLDEARQRRQGQP